MIVDRRGSRLAVNVEADSVYAVPRIIPDPAAFAGEVAPRLQLSVGEVEARLRRGGPHFAWLARRQAPQTAEAIRALHLGDQVGTLPDRLTAVADNRPRVTELRLWDSPWLFAFVLACLAAEWALRKRLGLA